MRTKISSLLVGIFLIAMLIGISACTSPKIIKGDKDLTLEQAFAIAKASECSKSGRANFTASANESFWYYYPDEKKWAFNMDPSGKTECHPACIIFSDLSVELMWRCTGAIPSSPEEYAKVPVYNPSD